jgi:2-polyprenyl-3-methyl-5-hydroxy-6-metoxy-1,4-benzoquinol methylase
VEVDILVKYKFLDIGTKAGGSLRTAAKRTGMLPSDGIGIDLRRGQLTKARQSGLTVATMDALHLGFRDGAFEFVWMTEFIEHMADERMAADAVREACRVTRGFVHIVTPNWECEEYLASLGLRFSWQTWAVHPFHVTEDALRRAIRLAGVSLSPPLVRSYPVVDSTHSEIVPLTAPRGTIHYSALEHDSKEHIRFEKPLYTKLECTLYL